MQKKPVRLDKRISLQCDKAIVISGSARSGTTILGAIINSLDRVEYVFEPPMLCSLFAIIDQIEEQQWRLLYETYLYEEFLISALAGRGLNCNLADDSSIYRAKSAKLIEERLGRSLRKSEADRLADGSRIAFKLPSIVPFLPKLKTYYPNTQVVVIVRDASATFKSLIGKGWFDEKSLREENRIWPNRFLDGMRVPFWVDPQDDEEWCAMSELDRTAYYYVRANEGLTELPDCLIVKYADLTRDPKATIEYLCERLGLVFGEKTEELLSTVSYRGTDMDDSFLKQVDPRLAEKVRFYSSMAC